MPSQLSGHSPCMVHEFDGPVTTVLRLCQSCEQKPFVGAAALTWIRVPELGLQELTPWPIHTAGRGRAGS